MPKRRRSTSVLQQLFADRQVYVRSGLASRYVALSRSAQIAAVAGFGLVVLWLGLASYAAVSKHLQTLEQGRELVRLESIARSLRTTVEQSQEAPAADPQAETVPDLVTELADAKAARERARALAKVAAGEAGELRNELELAQDQIRELKCALVQAEGARQAAAARVARLESTGPGAPDGVGLTLAGQLVLADPACPPD